MVFESQPQESTRPAHRRSVTANPAQPAGSSRFGLPLPFMQRRPRGYTNPQQQPPTETSYAFPGIRRQLSRRNGTPTERRNSMAPAEPPHGESGVEEANLTTTPEPRQNSSETSNTPESSNTNNSGQKYRLRLVPHLDSTRSLHFDPVDREMISKSVLRIGRFTDRSGTANTTGDSNRIAFKSKVVSRTHAEIWADDNGKFFIKDTKSSSGTFLNHIRLSVAATDSKPFSLKDGDVLQLGVDYQGGTEEIYRCVKMRVELNRDWQRGKNSFNTAAMAQLRALGGETNARSPKDLNISDCCICLYPVTVCQALFIAPCSHVTHYKCIRPLLTQNYPGFCCPLCRTYAHLEADVEVELDEVEDNTDEPEKDEEAPDKTTVATEPPAVIPTLISTRGPETVSDPNSNTKIQVVSPIPVPIPPRLAQQSTSSSLSEAATPQNNAFLSILANAESQQLPRFQTPVSLDMAVLGTPSLEATEGFAGPSSSLPTGHSDDDTDGIAEPLDGERDDKTPTSDGVKGKSVPGRKSVSLSESSLADSESDQSRKRTEIVLPVSISSNLSI